MNALLAVSPIYHALLRVSKRKKERDLCRWLPNKIPTAHSSFSCITLHPCVHFFGGAAPRSPQFSMNEFGMLTEIITEVNSHEGSLEAGSGGAGGGFNPLGVAAGIGGGPAGAQYRYLGSDQERTRLSGDGQMGDWLGWCLYGMAWRAGVGSFGGGLCRNTMLRAVNQALIETRRYFERCCYIQAIFYEVQVVLRDFQKRRMLPLVACASRAIGFRRGNPLRLCERGREVEIESVESGVTYEVKGCLSNVSREIHKGVRVVCFYCHLLFSFLLQ